MSIRRFISTPEGAKVASALIESLMARVVSSSRGDAAPSSDALGGACKSANNFQKCYNTARLIFSARILEHFIARGISYNAREKLERFATWRREMVLSAKRCDCSLRRR